MSALHSVELDVYRKALKSRKLTKSLASARLKQARKVARRALSILKKQFGVKKAVLFGSVVHPTLFHSRSDIDIAIWGLKGREYYRAVGRLQALDPDIGVDLISYEDASPPLKKIIQAEGRVL
ncbi:MAG: nucleotidyltransferase domain-containing protein [Anaerolineales bacterium]|nr:nucleotidyltransferase domain-containing protein [Anaerolineales bacterium]